MHICSPQNMLMFTCCGKMVQVSKKNARYQDACTENWCTQFWGGAGAVSRLLGNTHTVTRKPKNPNTVREINIVVKCMFPLVSCGFIHMMFLRKSVGFQVNLREGFS